MKKCILSLSLLITYTIAQTPAIAASSDECAVWLCLPTGFPEGCGAAKRAMLKRVKNFKSPLPDFSSCTVNPPQGSGSHMTYNHGKAAYIPEHLECNWDFNRESCITVPAQYIRHSICRIDRDHQYSPTRNSPAFCDRTVDWAEVFVEGKLTGPVYYFNVKPPSLY